MNLSEIEARRDAFQALTPDDFVKNVQALYEVWEGDPQPTFEEVLEWITTDRMQSSDYWEFKERAEKAEAELERELAISRHPSNQ